MTSPARKRDDRLARKKTKRQKALYRAKKPNRAENRTKHLLLPHKIKIPPRTPPAFFPLEKKRPSVTAELVRLLALTR